MTDQTAATECAFADEGCTCGRPRLTLTEAQARMAATPKPGPTFATYLDRTERDQLDARAACAEAERDDALADRDEAIEARDVARQTAAFRQGVIDLHAAELGAAGEVIAVVRDAQEQIERALARYDTAPEVTPVEPAKGTDELDDLRSPLAAERDQLVETIGRLVSLPPEQIAQMHEVGYTGVAASSVPPRRAQEDHAQGYAEAVARLRDDARYMHWWSSTGVQPDGPLRQHLADYLETVGPEVEPAAQDDEAVRRLLDQAIESALPQAGGNVRALLKALRRELKRVDVKRAEHADREG